MVLIGCWYFSADKSYFLFINDINVLMNGIHRLIIGITQVIRGITRLIDGWEPGQAPRGRRANPPTPASALGPRPGPPAID